MTTLREAGVVPFSWIVDNVRATIKSSSWSGLADFAETTRNAYRLDFWGSLPEYVHIICEKDAIAGTLAPVTREYDVALSPIRGYVSLSFAHEIGTLWRDIKKPVVAYYLGDYDPSGFDLERDCREKLQRYSDREFTWNRLGVNQDDFAKYDLIHLEAKRTDRRYEEFVRAHQGEWPDRRGPRRPKSRVPCAELDAIPPTVLRERLRAAIEQHVPKGEWKRLKKVEAAESASWADLLTAIDHGSPEPDGELDRLPDDSLEPGS